MEAADQAGLIKTARGVVSVERGGVKKVATVGMPVMGGDRIITGVKRVEVVRTVMIAAGIAGERIDAVGRGKREPLVPTEEGVAEPRNRRVEISIR
ncbi:MAG: hypothetical protein PHN75_08120 [Syntrophales bacterium]|nr:hypothetical protein [Syntrophales bacterium]